MKNLSRSNYPASIYLSNITTYQAGAMQASTNRVLQRHCDEILKSYGLTKMQWLIIGSVLDAGNKGIRITEVTKKLNTTMSYLTTTINLLESKNMLTRKENNDDSRSKLIYINKDFAPKCYEIEKTLRKSLRNSIYTHVNPKEFQIYMKVMYELARSDSHNVK